MSKPDHTLIVLSPGSPASETDTTCLPLQHQLLQKMQQLFPSIKIVVFAFQYPYSKKQYRWHDIQVIPFDGRNRGHVYKWIIRNKAMALAKTINEQSKIIGLLSFWYGECAYTADQIAARYDLPHYCWILGQDAKKENP